MNNLSDYSSEDSVGMGVGSTQEEDTQDEVFKVQGREDGVNTIER